MRTADDDGRRTTTDDDGQRRTTDRRRTKDHTIKPTPNLPSGEVKK